MSLLAAVVGLADDALVIGHRLSEWCGKAPFLEEDLAITNTALDFLDRARSLYAYAESLGGRNEDEYAYLRDAGEYRNLLIFELPGDDFALACARQFLVDVFDDLYLTALADSTDPTLAVLGARCRKASAYHLRHSDELLRRLGDGTAESRARMQQALAEVWGYHQELFEMSSEESDLASSGVLPHRGALASPWAARVDASLAVATLSKPTISERLTGGRSGVHTQHLSAMLAEMQQLPRAFPGAAW